MDLLEMNDIYCKDVARIKHDVTLDENVRIEYPFIPLEDPVFSNKMNVSIEAVVNHPFVGGRSVRFGHNLKEINDLIHVTPLTNYVDEEAGSFQSYEGRINDYMSDVELLLQYHLDLTFSDEIPGMTLIMDRFKNDNIAFTQDIFNEDKDEYIDRYVRDDARTLSLIYNRNDGSRLCGYGSVIFTGKNITSLPNELKLYLLSSVYLVGRCSDSKNFPGAYTMKTSCVIIYEDSIRRILNNITSEEV